MTVEPGLSRPVLRFGSTRWQTRSMRRALAIAFLLLIAACGDSGVEAGEIPAGFKTVDGTGFSIALPDDWVILQPDDINSEELFGDLGDANIPFTAEELSSVWDQGGVLFAFDVENATAEFVDNINILRFPRGGSTVAELGEQNLAEAAGAGLDVIDSGPISLPGGESFFIRYDWTSLGIEGIGYTVVTNSAEWQITLSALDIGPLEEEFAAALESFRER